MMRLGVSARRTAVLVAFMFSAVVIYLYLLTGTGVRLPIIQSDGYTVSVEFDEIDNLVPASQVQMAGVRVGDVRSVERRDGKIRVTFRLSDDVAPLHEGATVRLGEQSLIGESYLDLSDGEGAEIEAESSLPKQAALPSTQLHDVLADLDEETRNELSSLVRSLGDGTDGTRQGIDAVMAGLGDLGREGHTTLDALAAQSADLRRLSRNTTTLLDALDSGEGRIVSLVTAADRLTRATAGQADDVEDTIKALPSLMTSATSSAESTQEIAAALAPVAKNLRVAAPDLTTALSYLPGSLHQVKLMIPPFEGALDRLPPTLDRLPAFGKDVRSIVSPADDFMRDLNPMLDYLSPYGPEFGAFFANYNSALQYTDEAGLHYIRLIPHVNEQSL